MANPNRVLVVEDDAATLAWLDRVLGEAGYAVCLARDGEEALQAARRRPPDLVVADVGLPLMDGLELCRQVKADPVLGAVSVLLHTGHSSPEAYQRAVAAGADDVLAKSSDDALLVARVASILRLRTTACRTMAQRLGTEFNGPLTALFGHLELLGHSIDREDLSGAGRHLDECRRLSERLGGSALRLVRDLAV
jgi:DNA-binding response OmpR family regulator